MSSRDSKPSTNTNGTSSAEEQTRSTQELNEVEDLIPSTTESQAQDSDRIPQALSIVGDMLQKMSRNFEEVKEDVEMMDRDFSTLKRKFDTMESEHQKTVEYVDSLKHDLVAKKSKSKEAEAPQHTTIINEPTMPESSCSPTRMSLEGYQPLEHLGNFGNYVADESVIGGPSFEEFPSVGSATQRLPRSMRNRETVSEQTHVDPSAASQRFRRSDIRFYSQAIDPSGRFIAPPPTPVKKQYSRQGPSSSTSSRSFRQPSGGVGTTERQRSGGVPSMPASSEKKPLEKVPLAKPSQSQGYQTSRSATSFEATGSETVRTSKLEPIVEKPEAENQIVNEPIVEDPIVRGLVGEESTVEQLTVEQPIAEKPLGEKQIVSEPIVEEKFIREGLDKDESSDEALYTSDESIALDASINVEFAEQVKDHVLPLGDEEFEPVEKEEALQEGPSSSSTIQKPKAEKTYHKFTKQECKRRREFNKDFDEKVEQAHYYHNLVMGSEKNELRNTLIEYIDRMETSRQGTEYKALSEKVFEKFVSERYNHYRKIGKEKMCVFFMLLKENFHSCTAQDMYVLQQKLIASRQLDTYLDLEKEYYQLVSHKIHSEDGAGPSEPSGASGSSDVIKHLETVFQPILAVPPKPNVDEPDAEAIEAMIAEYIDTQVALRQLPYDMIDPTNVNNLTFALVKQHQMFANNPLKWDNAKAKEFFAQRATHYATLGMTGTRLTSSMYELLSKKDSDILCTDAMVLSNALRNPIKYYGFERMYIRLITEKITK